jgi:hypothetical protein
LDLMPRRGGYKGAGHVTCSPILANSAPKRG